jgi:hypothetical protein
MTASRLPAIHHRTLPALALLPALLTLLPCSAPPVHGDDTTPPTATPAAVSISAPVAQPVTPRASPLLSPKALSSDDFDRINASAHGLGGITASAGNATWESTPEWKDYQQHLASDWSYLERVRLNAMRIWGNTELSDLRGKVSTVFYPFSGPDALYADTLFPDSKVLLMAGLEPVGTMPDLARLQQEGKLAPYLGQLKTSLFTILAASFFKTKDMKNDFHNQLVDGLMPAIIVFIAREGYPINGIQYVALDHDGTLHAKGDGSGAPGVQVSYGDGRTLLYFQADLGNDGQKSNPGFVRLMHRLGPGITYLKAASYLLYEDYFSTIRDAILNDSVGVVEDDSGIPLKDFKFAEWDVVPYGNYTGPINLFKERYQPDLTDFYTKTPHQPLSFGSGYKFTASASSLLVAKKK